MGLAREVDLERVDIWVDVFSGFVSQLGQLQTRGLVEHGNGVILTTKGWSNARLT